MDSPLKAVKAGRVVTSSLWRRLVLCRRRRLNLAVVITVVIYGVINVLVVVTDRHLVLSQTLVAMVAEGGKSFNASRGGTVTTPRHVDRKQADQQSLRLSRATTSDWLNSSSAGQRRDSIGHNRWEDRSRDRHVRQHVQDNVTKCRVTSSDLTYGLPRGQLNRTEADRLSHKFRLDWNRPLQGDWHTPWNITDHWATYTHLYPEHAPDMGPVLKAMSTWPISRVSRVVGGYGTKLLFHLAGDQKVVFKLKWYSREYVWRGKPCEMADTHNGEIVTFHLARLLGFRNTPLAVGRKVNLTSEIVRMATSDIKKTVRNLPSHRSRDGRIEGALILWTPRHVTFKQSEHPWGGVCQALDHHGHFQYYLPHVNSSEAICRAAQAWRSFKDNPALFLDLVDSAILQYLVQNADRKMYLGTGLYRNFFPVLDNARSFGNPKVDIAEILAPLTHCCRVRESTYRRLMLFRNGALSHVLDDVTRGDPIYPLLSRPNMEALDRRLHQVLAHIEMCVCSHGEDKVILKI